MDNKAISGSRSWPFQLDEVDHQIAEIDAHDGLEIGEHPFSTGPFSVFQWRDPDLEKLSVEEMVKSDVAAFEYDSSESESWSPFDVTGSLSPASADLQLHASSPGRGVSPFSLELHPSIFQDPLIHRLMENYVHNVATVLPPLPHPENPYTSIYIPKALAGASNLLFGLSHVAPEVPSSNVAILHSTFEARTSRKAQNTMFWPDVSERKLSRLYKRRSESRWKTIKSFLCLILRCGHLRKRRR